MHMYIVTTPSVQDADVTEAVGMPTVASTAEILQTTITVTTGTPTITVVVCSPGGIQKESNPFHTVGPHGGATRWGHTVGRALGFQLLTLSIASIRLVDRVVRHRQPPPMRSWHHRSRGRLPVLYQLCGGHLPDARGPTHLRRLP